VSLGDGYAWESLTDHHVYRYNDETGLEDLGPIYPTRDEMNQAMKRGAGVKDITAAINRVNEAMTCKTEQK